MKKLSNWVNTQNIFNANAGQGERMNDDIYGSLEQLGQDTQKKIGSASRGFEQAASNNAGAALKGMNTATSSGADAAAQQRYGGPRTIKEFDPNISSQVADAAGRIGQSQLAQYQGKYGSASAGGSAIDRALMGQAGGNTRYADLQKNYGDLTKRLGVAQQGAAQFAQGRDDAVTQAALAAAAKAPGLRQQEAVAKRRKADDDIVRANYAKREAYDAAYDRENRKYQHRGGELQAVYSPPESAMLPYYPEDSESQDQQDYPLKPKPKDL